MFGIKIKNLNYFSKYIIWASDSALSVLSTSFCFLFFHYLMKVDTDVQTVAVILFIAVAVSIDAYCLCHVHQSSGIYHLIQSFTRIYRFVYLYTDHIRLYHVCFSTHVRQSLDCQFLLQPDRSIG